MARIGDNAITRVSPVNLELGQVAAFKTTWKVVCGETSGTIDWQYHANGKSVDNGREWVVTSAPDSQQHSPHDITGMGSDLEPNYVTNARDYWPNTRTRLIAVNNDVWCDGHQNTAWWPFYEPLPPKVEMHRSDLVVTYSLDPNRSQQGENSHYWPTRTRYGMYLSTPSSGGVSVRKYAIPSDMYTEESTEKLDEADSYTSTDAAPETPVRIEFYAVNEGPSGMSEVAEGDPYVFARVNAPSIRLSSVSEAGVVFAVDTHWDLWHPVDHIILERRKGTGSWSSVQDVEDDAARVRVMADYTTDRLPDEDEDVYYRVRVWHTMESNSAYAELPDPVLAGKPKAPSVGSGSVAADGDMTVSYTVGSGLQVTTRAQVWDGTELVWSGTVEDGALYADGMDPAKAYTVRMWNERNGMQSAVAEGTVNESGVLAAALSVPVIDALDQLGDGTSLRLGFHYGSSRGDGTEVSWSDRADGWEATSDPSTCDMADAGSRQRHLSIVGLDEGERVWVRCRRYIKVDSDTVYGGWSSTETAIPESTPESVTLNAPTVVEAGGAIEYTWGFTDTNDTPQTKAILTVGGASVQIDGPVCAYTWPTTEDQAGNTLSAEVRVSTGGGWSDASKPVTTAIAARPVCAAKLAGKTEAATEQAYGGTYLTAMPLELDLSGGGSYEVTVTAATGIRQVTPTGDVVTTAGDVVSRAVVSGSGPVCESGLVGGGAYDVSVTCTDASTGLTSDPVTIPLTVRWASPAEIPTARVAVNDGRVTLRASGAGTLNVYRATADGYIPCLIDGKWDVDYYDPVPPYGWDGCGYAVESVTPDGDRVWAEVAYESVGGAPCTVDWPQGTLTLPFNLDLSSDYTTNFEARTHLDGSTAGYWAPGHTRTARVGSEEIKRDSELARTARELGRYAGLCFVRGPQGVAFACHADVSLSDGYNSAIRTFDLSLTEVDDDGTYYLKTVGEDA